jgi:hypothetical protein
MRTPAGPYRTDSAVPASTHRERERIDIGSAVSRDEIESPLAPRRDTCASVERSGVSVGSRGLAQRRTDRIAQLDARVRQSCASKSSDCPNSAPNGHSIRNCSSARTLHLSTSVTPETNPYTDRSGCEGRPGAHHPLIAGTAAALRRGCTCPDAIADRDYRRRRHAAHYPDVRLVDNTATARRLQALAAIGWSNRALAEHLGINRSRIRQLRNLSSRRVTADTERAVAWLYRELSDTPGGDIRAKNWARKLGYHPPLAWDDDTIADPDAPPYVECTARAGQVEVYEEFLLGELLRSKWVQVPLPLRGGGEEQRPFNDRATAALVGIGRSSAEIAYQLGVSERVVTRYRARLAAIEAA